MSADPNNRQSARYPVNIRIRLRPAGADWIEGSLLSAGPRGAFIKTTAALRLEQTLELELPLRHGKELLPGRVRWIAEEEPRGYGIQFLDLSPVLEDQLIDAITAGLWLSDAPTPATNADTRLIVVDLKKYLDEL